VPVDVWISIVKRPKAELPTRTLRKANDFARRLKAYNTKHKKWCASKNCLIAKAAPGRQRGVVSIALAAAIPLIGVRLLGDVIRFRFRIRDAISIAVAPAAAGDFLRLAVPLQLRRLATGAESQVSGLGRFFLFFPLAASGGYSMSVGEFVVLYRFWPTSTTCGHFPLPKGVINISVYIFIANTSALIRNQLKSYESCQRRTKQT